MQQKKRIKTSERGASIIEILVIVVIIAILTIITTMSLLTPKKYKAEAQALSLIDLMREAQQRALSEKKTMRVQIDSANRQIQLINENEPTLAADGSTQLPTSANDVVVKTIPYVSDSVFVGIAPSNMTASPVETTPVTPISFSGNQAVLRFKTNGTVHNAGNNVVGDGSVPTGRTIYVWTKKESEDPQSSNSNSNSTTGDIFRAVTVIGSSGTARLWKGKTVYNQITKEWKCDGWVR